MHALFIMTCCIFITYIFKFLNKVVIYLHLHPLFAWKIMMMYNSIFSLWTHIKSYGDHLYIYLISVIPVIYRIAMNLDLCQQYLYCRSWNRIMMLLYACDKQSYGFTGNDKNNSNFHTYFIENIKLGTNKSNGFIIFLLGNKSYIIN